VLTTCVLAVAGRLVLVAGVGPLGAVIWCLLFAPWILRDLWRRQRIR